MVPILHHTLTQKKTKNGSIFFVHTPSIFFSLFTIATQRIFLRNFPFFFKQIHETARDTHFFPEQQMHDDDDDDTITTTTTLM